MPKGEESRNDERETDDPVLVRGPEGVATRFGPTWFSQDHRFQVQELTGVPPLEERQREIFSDAESKATQNNSSVVLSTVVNISPGEKPWLAWEYANGNSLAWLISSYVRRFEGKAKTLTNLARLFSGIARALDAAKETGWDSPFLDLGIERIYFEFETPIKPSDFKESKELRALPPFKVRLVPFSMDYLFPVSSNSDWHESPLVVRFAGLINEVMGGEMAPDGVPRRDYRGGLPAMSGRANSQLHNTLESSKDGETLLAGETVAEWFDCLLVANEARYRAPRPVELDRTPGPDGAKTTEPVAPVLPDPELIRPQEVPVADGTSEKGPPAPSRPETPSTGLTKSRILGVATLVVIAGGTFLWQSTREPSEVNVDKPTVSGSFETKLTLAESLEREARFDEAAAAFLEAIDLATDPSLRESLWRKAYEMRSVDAAFYLAKQSGEPIENAAKHFRQAADWIRDGVAVLVQDPGLTEAGALREAAELGDGVALYRLGELERVAGRNQSAIEAFSKAAVIFENGSDVTEPDPGGTLMAHTTLVTLGHKSSGVWLAKRYGTTNPKRAAEDMYISGNFSGAAERWMAVGETEKAVNSWLRAGETGKAAEAWKIAGEIEKAAEVLISAGDIAAAAALWVDSGRLDRAVQIWTERENWDEVSNIWKKAGDVAKAAAVWEQQGEFGKVAEVWVEAGQTERATDLLIEKGRGTLPNDEKRRLFLQAIELGDPEGRYQLGLLEEAAENHRQAATAYETFHREVTNLDERDWRPEWAEILNDVSRRAFDLGVVNIIENIAASEPDPKKKGILYWRLHEIWTQGNLLEAANSAKAEEALNRAASTGHGEANLRLAERFAETGDWKEAVFRYDLASQAGEDSASEKLGDLYRVGDPPEVPPDPEEAAVAFRKAANAGVASAMWKLGELYADENSGVSLGSRGADQSEAVRLYRSAANEGDAEGIFRLASCYFSGSGVEKDLAEARRLFQRGSDLGHKGSDRFLQLLPEPD